MPVTRKSLDELLPREPAETFRLTLDQVEAINRKRAQYVAVYFAWFLLQTYILLTAAPVDGISQRIAVLGTASLIGLAFFYWRFVSVLRSMGYNFFMWLPICFLALMPIPGILVVAYIDRTISKTLVKGFNQRDKELANQRDAASNG